MSKKKMFFSIEKAKKELGYNPRPVDEAIKDSIDWFRQKGYIP
jgi:dihydroflavonol-4-reductase